MALEAIRAGDIETALKDTDDDEGKLFSDYICKRRSVPVIAEDEGVAYEIMRWRLKGIRKLVKKNASEFLNCKYKYGLV